MRVDILMSVPGVVFDDAWQGCEEVTIEGVIVPFISKLHLIESKHAAGRPQDLLGAQALE